VLAKPGKKLDILDEFAKRMTTFTTLKPSFDNIHFKIRFPIA